MTILDELKNLILARGGDVSGVQRISEAVEVLVSLEPEEPEEPEET